MLEQHGNIYVGKSEPAEFNCKVRPNLNAIMQMHKVAIEKHNNQQPTDLLLDKWNAGKRQEMMETAVRVMNTEVDELYDMRSIIDEINKRESEK